jgi:acylphosphatase
MAARKRVIVSGRVQGVFFRDTCRHRAQEEGVAGWVSNMLDGRVEAVFEGEPFAVDRMVAWCREGTPLAQIADVEVIDEEPENETGFQIH